MAKAYGLDIGTHSVKLVVLDGTAKKYKVVKFVSREVGEVGGVAETVAAVLKEGRAHRDNLVVALDSKSVVIREILVPFTQDDQIRRVLRYEAEAHLHNYAIEDVVVDHLKVGEMKDQSKVLIFAAPKDGLRENLDLLQAAGVDPMHVQLDMAALFNASRASGAFEEHPDAVVLDIGATTTNMVFVRAGEMKSCRSLRSGADSLTRVLSQDLAVDVDAARERSEQGDRSGQPGDLLTPIPLDDDEVPDLDKSAAELETAIVVQRQDDFLTRIFRETTRSLATVSSGSSAYSAIFVTGAASLTGGIQRRLEERFGKPVIPLQFLAESCRAVPAAEHERVNASMGVAMGCALKLVGHEGVELEFRREDLRYTRKFDLIKVALASAVSLVFILLFLVWLDAQNTLRVRRVEYKNILDLAQGNYLAPTVQQYKEVLGNDARKLPGVSTDPFQKLRTWLKQTQTMLDHMTSEMGDAKGVPPVRSALGIWKEFFEKLEDNRREFGYLKLDTLKITQKTVSFDGLVGERGHIDLIERELRRIKDRDGVAYIKDVRRDRTEADRSSGQIRFGMTIYLEPLGN